MRHKPGLSPSLLRTLSGVALVSVMLALFILCPGCTSQEKPLDVQPCTGQD